MASSAQAKQFIETIGPIIQDEAKARGYKVCSPIIAQACIESAYGTSSLGYRWHNYFGMKCGSAWKGPSVNLATKEEYNSQLVSIRDNFRVYDSMEEGVKGYFDFISTNRYANLKTALTPLEYLQRIKADGYATSSTYVNTCMSCLLKYDLSRFDSVQVVYPEPTRLLKKGVKGDDVRWLQKKLLDRGYPVGNIDGIYGTKTEQCVKQFQTDVFVDGLCGPLTIEKLK